MVTPEERRLEGLLGDIMGLFRAVQRRAQEAEQAAAQLEMNRRPGEPVPPLGGVIPPLLMGANQCEGRDNNQGGEGKFTPGLVLANKLLTDSMQKTFAAGGG